MILVGCGSEPVREAKPGFVVAAAADKTTVGSARVAGSTALERGSDRVVIQRVVGEQNFDAKTSRLKMTSPLSDFDPTKEDVVLEAISLSTTSYQSISGMELPPGKRWIRFDASDLGVQNTKLQSWGSGDPADGLQFLAGVRNVRRTGQEEIRGTETTRYTVTIDLSLLMELIAKGSKKLSPDFAKGLDVLRDRVDLTRLPGEVSLDSKGRVRRMRYSLSVPSDGKTIRVSTDLEYFDFGAPVSISAPPVDTTVPFADVADQWRGFFSDLQAGTGSDRAA